MTGFNFLPPFPALLERNNGEGLVGVSADDLAVQNTLPFSMFVHFSNNYLNQAFQTRDGVDIPLGDVSVPVALLGRIDDQLITEQDLNDLQDALGDQVEFFGLYNLPRHDFWDVSGQYLIDLGYLLEDYNP